MTIVVTNDQVVTLVALFIIAFGFVVAVPLVRTFELRDYVRRRKDDVYLLKGVKEVCGEDVARDFCHVLSLVRRGHRF